MDWALPFRFLVLNGSANARAIRCRSIDPMPPCCRVIRHPAYFSPLKHKHSDGSTHTHQAGCSLTPRLHVRLSVVDFLHEWAVFLGESALSVPPTSCGILLACLLATHWACGLGAQLTVIDSDAHYPE